MHAYEEEMVMIIRDGLVFGIVWTCAWSNGGWWDDYDAWKLRRTKAREWREKWSLRYYGDGGGLYSLMWWNGMWASNMLFWLVL